jgi:ribosomal protein L11 methyltransferase
LKAWFLDPDQAAVDAMLTEVGCVGTWGVVPDVDWEESWKVGFAPIQISERLVIAPPWDAPPGSIVIEPGQGFGTGQHPTTKAALRALNGLADRARTALDVGCGSGILAIAAARLGLAVRGIDVEPAAIKDALKNAAQNGCSIHFDTAPLCTTRAADIVLANLHAELLVDLASELCERAGQWLILAGILADREHKVREAFDSRLVLAERTVNGEWVCLVYRK